jgi:hypothetical protein
VTPSHLTSPLSCLARAALTTEETETNIVVDGNERDDAKKGGGRSIVIALVVSDATAPPHPLLLPLPTLLSSPSSSPWDGDGVVGDDYSEVVVIFVVRPHRHGGTMEETSSPPVPADVVLPPGRCVDIWRRQPRRDDDGGEAGGVCAVGRGRNRTTTTTATDDAV